MTKKERESTPPKWGQIPEDSRGEIPEIPQDSLEIPTDSRRFPTSTTRDSRDSHVFRHGIGNHGH